MTTPPIRRRLRRSAVAILAAGALAVPFVASPSLASWNDEEWVSGDVSTLAFDCGADTGYQARSEARFLGGSLLGTDLDAVADLEGTELVLDAGGLDVSPDGASEISAAPPTFANPLDLGLLQTLPIDLSGLAVGLPAGSAGAVNQWAQVSDTGTAAAAAGLVSDSGGVQVTDSTPSTELPEPASISLKTLLPVVADQIADVSLDVGAVASSVQLEGCAALESLTWGDGSVTAVRDYGIAGLDLMIDAPPVAGLIGTVNAAVSGLQTAVDALQGEDGLLAGVIRDGVLGALGTVVGDLGLGALTGTVEIDGLDLQASIGTLLTTPLTDGIVTIDLSAGTIGVDLAALLSEGSDSLNGLAANSELILNAAVINAIVSRVTSLLDTWTAAVTSAITAALYNAELTIALQARVTLTGIDVIRLDIGFDDSIGDLLAGSARFVISTAVLPGLGPIVSGLLSLLLSPLTAALGALVTGLLAPVTGVVLSTVISLVTTLGATLSSITTPLVATLATVLSPLPGLLSLTVNVQPDQPGAPPGTTYTPATRTSTASYAVSALRIGIADALGTVTSVSLATSTAGPVSLPVP